MSRFVIRGVASLTAIGMAALAFATQASAASTYRSGELVRVEGAEVVAPAPGSTVAISIDRLGGESSTQVVSTDSDGVVTVSENSATAAQSSSADKCSDSAYTLLGGASWPAGYEWRFRASTTPKGMSVKTAKSALRTSVNNISRADNSCGLTDGVRTSNRFMGVTTAPSDVTSAPGCGAPSGQNVTEFGDIGGSNILAITCVYSAGADLVAASVRINTDYTWWTGGSCNGAYGLKATMTHEYGHAFGLGHVDESGHGNLTMSSGINASCSNFEASLGRGDVLALRALY